MNQQADNLSLILPLHRKIIVLVRTYAGAHDAPAAQMTEGKSIGPILYLACQNCQHHVTNNLYEMLLRRLAIQSSFVGSIWRIAGGIQGHIPHQLRCRIMLFLPKAG